MSRKSISKGKRVERLIVNLLRRAGLSATRMWGSSGRSRGLHEEVDIIIELTSNGQPLVLTAQVKAKKRIPKWLKAEADFVIVKGDYEMPRVIVPFAFFTKALNLMKD